jgi:hypothetical protein
LKNKSTLLYLILWSHASIEDGNLEMKKRKDSRNNKSKYWIYDKMENRTWWEY